MNGLGLMFLVGFLSFPAAPELDSRIVARDGEQVQWSCREPAWKGEPSVSQGMFVGTLELACEFTLGTHGDYERLRAETIDELKKQATKIHAGPTEETFEGLASTYFDALVPTGEEGLEAIRADTHIASDGKGVYVFATASKEIIATGTAQNVKRIDNIARVKRGTHDGSHGVVVSVTTHVKKPGLVPAGTFKNLVVNEMETKLKENEKGIVELIAQRM